MADITENEVRQLITLNLADESGIPATKHRDVENKIMDYVIQEIAKTTKSKVLMLDSFTTDRNYSVTTNIPSNADIDSVVVMLVCKTGNNGFVPGEVVTAPTPYPADNGRTAAQGIGVQYNNFSNGSIKVMVNKQLTIMTAYNSASGATVSNVSISGVDSAKWSIKLIVGYK